MPTTGAIPLLFHVAYTDGRPAESVWLGAYLQPDTDIDLLRVSAAGRADDRARAAVALLERHLARDDQGTGVSSADRFALALADSEASIALSDLETMVERIRIDVEGHSR